MSLGCGDVALVDGRGGRRDGGGGHDEHALKGHGEVWQLKRIKLSTLVYFGSKVNA